MKPVKAFDEEIKHAKHKLWIEANNMIWNSFRIQSKEEKLFMDRFKNSL